MDLLYRIFYTVLSLGILTIIISPIALLFRALIIRYERKYAIWEWRFVYLRCICPIALSSPLCMVPSWNRRFHLLLSELGLALENRSGIMNSWKAVFEGKITTTSAFRACTVIWLAGVAVILLATVINYIRVRISLSSAKLLGENVYESEYIKSPIRIGLFKEKIYLPKGTMVYEVMWYMEHIQYHQDDVIRRILVTVITAIHWFNPVIWLYYYLWCLDEEIDKDERTIESNREKSPSSYAQALLHFLQLPKKHIMPSILTKYERCIEKRASHLMYQKKDTVKNVLAALLALFILLIWLFFLVPLQIAWLGGTWGALPAEKVNDELFGDKTELVIAKTTIASPEGLERLLQLEMTSGKESESGYDGKFIVAMYDATGNYLCSEKVSDIFSQDSAQTYHFSKGLALCAADYNDDGIQELVLGQELNMSQEEFETVLTDTDKLAGTSIKKKAKAVSSYRMFKYSLVNIEDKALEIVCDEIYTTTKSIEQNESMHFEVPKDAKTIFTIPLGEESLHYVWNGNKREYNQMQLSEEELEEHKKSESIIGQTKEHTLENSEGTTKVMVTTKRDSTNSEAIQSIILSPRNDTKKFEDIQGYYCDLFWIPTLDDEKERYAMVIYNGSKSQTFIIYDTQKQKVYYRHEDGTDMLKALFEQYNEKQISFNERNAVIYNVSEKKEDTLTISFAANADDEVAIKGSYDFDVANKVSKNLTFTRSGGGTK